MLICSFIDKQYEKENFIFYDIASGIAASFGRNDSVCV